MYLEDPRIDGRIILKLMFEKWNGGGGAVDWIDVAQDRDSWQAVVNVVKDLYVP
jgi:hypothetical protein